MPDESALLSGDRGGNGCNEVGRGRVEDFEELTQVTASVGCLLLKLRHYDRFFLAKDLNQEGLWVQRADAPPLQVFTPEVAKVESYDDGAWQWIAAASTWRSFSSFVIRGISGS
jgi:hypothetical protein